jgi:hypothetical protein
MGRYSKSLVLKHDSRAFQYIIISLGKPVNVIAMGWSSNPDTHLQGVPTGLAQHTKSQYHKYIFLVLLCSDIPTKI